MIKDILLGMGETTIPIKGIRKYGSMNESILKVLRSEDDVLCIITFTNNIQYRRIQNIGAVITKL